MASKAAANPSSTFKAPTMFSFIDSPSQSSRITALRIASGNATEDVSSIRRLRKLLGFADRKLAWTHILFPNSSALTEDQARYKSKLQSIFAKCPGCEELRCDHVYGYGASYLRRFIEADEELIGWEEQVFRVHEVRQQADKDAIKRVLIVLESDYDFDFAAPFIDLVCILMLYLSEVQTYAACRRLATTSSSTFIRMNRSKRKGMTPRRLVPMSFTSQMTLGMLFIDSISKSDPKLGLVLKAHENEVSMWFERLLIPILPMDHVLNLMDCLLAGDDVKILLRACATLVKSCRSKLMQVKEGKTLTSILRSRASEERQLKVTRWAIPKRRVLIEMEAACAKKVGRVHHKLTVAHFSRETFVDSTTILTPDAASRLIKFIPAKYRHTSVRMQSIYQSDLGPIAENKVSDIYKAAETENSAFVLVVVAKLPKSHSDLNEAEFREDRRTASTNFAHPLVKDANYVVFGLFSPSPLRASFSQTSLTMQVNASETAWDEDACVFRLAPSHVSQQWHVREEAKAQLGNIITCMSNGLVVGKATPPTRNGENGGESKAIGPALQLDEKLTCGSSGYSETFHNEPLCFVRVKGEAPVDYEANPALKSQHFYFNIFAVELFALPKV